MKKYIVLGAVLAALITQLIGINVNAQSDEQGLSISPVVFELSADPNDNLTNEIKVINPTDSTVNVEMSVEDFFPVGDEGQVVLDPDTDNSTFSIADWTTITPSEFSLGANEQVIVKFSIEVPSNAEPGGHYGSIVASITGSTVSEGGAVVGTKRGALVLLRVSGDVVEELEISDFSTEELVDKGPIDFNLKFKNTGNVHLRPAGFINITNIFGNEVAQIEIPQNNVIPGYERQANVVWDNEDLLGRYTATVVANYGNETKQTVTSTITFTVIPVKTVAIAALLILVVLIIIYLSRKRISLAGKALLGKN